LSVTSAPSSRDAFAIPIGTNEELAGPPHVDTMRPVSLSERISSVDVLRGFSLMGILVANITLFSMPGWNYTFPLTTVKPVFNGPHWQINTICWFLRWMLVEGKMRVLFSMLFGAGVILLTRRAEERGAGIRAADIYTRRNMWLVLFGTLHCIFIWNGDILFFYGMSALIFLFPFRNLRPRTLILTGVAVLMLNTLIVPVRQTMRASGWKRDAASANVALANHQVLNEAQITALEDWKSEQDRWRPGTEKLYADIAAHQHGYLSQRADASDAIKSEIDGAHTFGDWVGLMLLGMALFRLGFFSLKCTTRTYILTAIIGISISMPLTFVGCWHAWRSGFDLFTTAHWLLYPYDLARVTGGIGYAAVLLLLVRSGVFKWMFARVASIGQMALSNYILNSLVMKMIFVWGPLHWYGYMDYYKLYYVVAAEWIVNLTFSTLWLRHFRFGPLEWCWRSLTYWKRQPMLLHSTPDNGAPTAAIPAIQT
jgi:uncharacterized protein